MDTSTTSCDFYNPVNLGTDSFAYGSSTCTTEYSFTIPSNESGFTWGELVTSYLLFGILIVLAYQFLYTWVKGQKVRA